LRQEDTTELLERLRRLLAEDPTLATRLAAITGDGNVVGDHNVATVTKQSAGDYAIQIGQLHLTLSPDQLRSLPVSAVTPSPLPATPTGLPRQLWPLVGGAAVLLVVIGIAVAVLLRLIGTLALPTFAPQPTETQVPPTTTPQPTETQVPPTTTPQPTEMPTPVGPPAEADIGDTWTRPADGMVMVYVPAGEFLMGSSEADDQARDDEKPQHTVYLDGYWIDRTEVTNAQYHKCVEAGHCREAMCQIDDNLNAPDQPVACVDWDDAQEYAAWAGGRLPTEAEWEKAARGTDGRIYPWGNSAPNCDKGNYGDCLGHYPAVVGSYPLGASPYGALDMAGNVWEWVADWYEEGYYDRSPARNPQGPDGQIFRVLRGGGSQLAVPCAGRNALYWRQIDGEIGFRVVVAPALPPTFAPQPTEMPTPACPPTGANIGDTWTRPADGMVMVYVPAGEFLMGSSEADGQADDDEKPQHTVYLDGYWIDRTEVTNAQYRKCVEARACREPQCWDDEELNAPDQPVVCVNWDDAREYAAWAGGRLPTEAEWEKAARGIDGRIYPWGDEFDGTRVNYCDRNCYGDYKDTGADDGYAVTAPVGSYLSGASPYGALDMAGNVGEWVTDWYGEEYYARSPARNPQGPDAGHYRVLRGGGFFGKGGGVRCAARVMNVPRSMWIGLIGFRVVTAPALPPTFAPQPSETQVPSTTTPQPTEMPTPVPPPGEADIGDTWTRPRDDMVMVYVPAGEFLMGSSDADGLAEDDEKPRHTVYLGAYWIDRTEVTNAQYRKCVEAGACREPGCWGDDGYNAPDQPVVCVTWDDAQAYAAWVGGRLPTEAEWEKAARGTDGRIYPWGDEFDGTRLNYCDRNCEYYWKDTGADDGYAAAAPVGSYPPGASPYGALDMAGNAEEWTSTLYLSYPYRPDDGREAPEAEGRRVVRGGGSWVDDQRFARCASRSWNMPDSRFLDLVGFRVVVSRAPG